MKHSFTPEKFVVVWMEAASLADVCAAFRLSPDQASHYASSLRAAGVPLPRMHSTRGRTLIDVPTLSRIVSSYRGGPRLET